MWPPILGRYTHLPYSSIRIGVRSFVRMNGGPIYRIARLVAFGKNSGAEGSGAGSQRTLPNVSSFNTLDTAAAHTLITVGWWEASYWICALAWRFD